MSYNLKPLVLECPNSRAETILPPDSKLAIDDFLQVSNILAEAQSIEIKSKIEGLDLLNIERVYTVRYENSLKRNSFIPGLKGISKTSQRTSEERGIGWRIISNGPKILLFTDIHSKFVSYVIPEVQ